MCNQQGSQLLLIFIMQGRRNKEKMSTHLLGARHQDGGSQDHEQSDALAICLKLGEQAVAWLRSHLPATEIFQIYPKKKKKVNLYHRTASLGAYVQANQIGQDADSHSTILAV